MEENECKVGQTVKIIQRTIDRDHIGKISSVYRKGAPTYYRIKGARYQYCAEQLQLVAEATITERLPADFGILCYNKEDSEEAGRFIETYYTKNHNMSWNNTGNSVYALIDGRVECWNPRDKVVKDLALFTLQQIRDFLKEDPMPKSEIINSYSIY